MCLAGLLASSACASEDVHVVEIRRDLIFFDQTTIPIDDDLGGPVVDGLGMSNATGTLTVLPEQEAPMAMLQVEQLPQLLSADFEYRGWLLEHLDGRLEDLLTDAGGEIASFVVEPDEFGLATSMIMEPMVVIEWERVRGVWLTIEAVGATAPAESADDPELPAFLCMIGILPADQVQDTEQEGGGGHEH